MTEDDTFKALAKPDFNQLYELFTAKFGAGFYNSNTEHVRFVESYYWPAEEFNRLCFNSLIKDISMLATKILAQQIK